MKAILQDFFASKEWEIVKTAGEILFILWWALFVGREYFNFQPGYWPIGGDFPLTIQSFYLWELLPECGSCVMWNGFINGGNPAFVETHGAFLHPITILTTLFFGTINGTKVTLLTSLFIAGMAQWWLAREMKLGFISRMWISFLAVIGGHLAGRMEGGLIGIILSTAMGALIVPATWRLLRVPNRKHSALLAVLISLVVLSGQGYIQFAMVIFLGVAFFLNPEKSIASRNATWKSFGWAGIGGLLLSSILLIPLIRFLPHFIKPISQPFEFAQSLQYQPLNLIIADFEVYLNTTLGKIAFPAVFMTYIGWLPVAAAISAVFLWPKEQRRKLILFVLPVILIYSFSAQEFGTFLGQQFEKPLIISRLRFPSLMIGFAIPLILGLAAWGLDRISKTAVYEWRLKWDDDFTIKIPIAQLVLIGLCLLNLKSVYEFSDSWLTLVEMPPSLAIIADKLSEEETQWIEPTQDAFWNPYFMDEGLKGTRLLRPWGWGDRDNPLPQIQGFRSGDEKMTGTRIFTLDGFRFNQMDELPYAYVHTVSDKIIPCQAESRGGNIVVACDIKTEGTLFIRENMWDGWQVSRDGSRVEFEDFYSDWMVVHAPEGKHTYEFRYRPWDVPVGAALSIIGLGLSIWLWRTSAQDKQEQNN
jgi:hypothetical protein